MNDRRLPLAPRHSDQDFNRNVKGLITVGALFLVALPPYFFKGHDSMDQASDFDPATFLDSTTTEQSVRRPPLDPGDYTAVTGELKARKWTSDKPTAKIKSGIAFDVPLTVEVPFEQQQRLKLTTSTITMNDSIMIELTSTGGIDYGVGKNSSLRRWREATNLNAPGEPFSPRMLTGKVVKVKIGHRIAEAGPSQGEVFDEIQGVAKP